MLIRSRLIAVCALLPVLALAQPAAYFKGQEMLNSHRWQDALDAFNQLAPKGVDSEGLQYWKAFALAQLGRKDDALTALFQIRIANASSGWLKEANVLETALRGQFKPEPEDTEIFKLLNDARGDAERTLAIAQTIWSEPHTPRTKSNLLSTIQRIGSEASRKVLNQVAHGSVNPDLQRASLSLLGRSDPQALLELYPSLPDADSKRLILSILGSLKDKDRILQLARGEKVENVRLAAYSALVTQAGGAVEASSLLASEPSVRLKQMVTAMIEAWRKSSDSALVDLRSANPLARQKAASTLARSSDPLAGPALEAAYAIEKDATLKSAFVFALIELREFEKVRALAVAETDTAAKRSILQRLILDDEGIKTIR